LIFFGGYIKKKYRDLACGVSYVKTRLIAYLQNRAPFSSLSGERSGVRSFYPPRLPPIQSGVDTPPYKLVGRGYEKINILLCSLSSQEKEGIE